MKTSIAIVSIRSLEPSPNPGATQWIFENDFLIFDESLCPVGQMARDLVRVCSNVSPAAIGGIDRSAVRSARRL